MDRYRFKTHHLYQERLCKHKLTMLPRKLIFQRLSLSPIRYYLWQHSSLGPRLVTLETTAKVTIHFVSMFSVTHLPLPSLSGEKISHSKNILPKNKATSLPQVPRKSPVYKKSLCQPVYQRVNSEPQKMKSKLTSKRYKLFFIRYCGISYRTYWWQYILLR